MLAYITPQQWAFPILIVGSLIIVVMSIRPLRDRWRMHQVLKYNRAHKRHERKKAA